MRWLLLFAIGCGGTPDDGPRDVPDQTTEPPTETIVPTTTTAETQCVVTRHWDDGGDGTVEAVEVDTEDSAGRVTEARDESVDGDLLWVQRTTYDEEGNPLTFEEGPDAAILWIVYKNKYGTKGLLEIEDTTTSNAFYGEVVGRTTYNWGGGVVASVDRDDDDDGVPEYRISFTYDSQGLVVEEEWEESRPGSPDLLVYYTYDGERVSTKEVWERYDYAFDFAVLESFEYDGEGSQVQSTFSDRADKANTQRVSHDLTYDGDVLVAFETEVVDIHYADEGGGYADGDEVLITSVSGTRACAR